MKQKKKNLISLCSCLLLIGLLFFYISHPSYAGFGDFNDYDSGSDWGSSSDWDSGSDWGSSWDDDYSYSSSGDYSYSGSGDYSGGSFMLSAGSVIFYFTLIFYFIIRNMMRKSMRSRINDTVPVPKSTIRPLDATKILPDRTSQIADNIKKTDPNFTSTDFISYVKRVYVDIQDAWCKRDLTSVQTVLHPNLYQQTEKQIQKKIEAGIVNHLERISVNTSYLSGYRKDSQYEYIIVYLAAQMIDYQIEEKTGKIIFGDKTTRWSLQYKMTFMRSIGMLTPSEEEKEDAMNCPNCGAPINATAFGKCEYCNSMVTTGKYGWVLSDFGVVKNDTVDEGIQIN